MARFTWFLPTGLWLIAASVAACGSVGEHRDARSAQAPESDYQVLQAPSPGASDPGVIRAFPFLLSLKLTPAQTTRLTNIITRMSASEAQPKLDVARFQTVMLAPVLDKAALRTLLSAAETQQRAQQAHGASILAAVRTELTATQRTEASQSVLKASSQSAPPEAGQMPPGLSATQKALFEASRPPRLAPAASAKALSAFLRTGDKAAFISATAPARSVAAQVEATVKAFDSLTLAQRRTLFGQPPSGGR